MLIAASAVPRTGPAIEWAFTTKILSKKLKYLPLEYKLHRTETSRVFFEIISGPKTVCGPWRVSAATARHGKAS